MWMPLSYFIFNKNKKKPQKVYFSKSKHQRKYNGTVAISVTNLCTHDADITGNKWKGGMP